MAAHAFVVFSFPTVLEGSTSDIVAKRIPLLNLFCVRKKPEDIELEVTKQYRIKFYLTQCIYSLRIFAKLTGGLR